MNTIIQQLKGIRYTWTIAGAWVRYQIDYILLKKRYKNQVKSYPGADLKIDKNLVIMKTEIRLKKRKLREKRKENSVWSNWKRKKQEDNLVIK